MTSVVLVIDVQQGLCEGSGAAHDCVGTIERINSVTHQARESGVAVIFIQHESEFGYLEYKTEAWKLANRLNVESDDLTVRKTTPDSFLRTNLQELLQQLDATELVVCGMHTEFCVDTTIRKALALAYPVTLVSDAHTSAGNIAISAQQVIAHHNATLTNISSFGPRVIAVPSNELNLSE